MPHLFFFLLFVFFSSFAEAGPLIDQLEGTYYRDLRGGYTDGDDYWSEDTFKLVKAEGDTAYFRYELNFYNGQTCSLHGIAEERDGKLYYTDPRPQTPPACSLTIEMEDKKILTSETTDYSRGTPFGGCKAYCGSRGSFDEAVFRMRSRKLFYPGQIKQIKKSKEYKTSLDAYMATLPPAPTPATPIDKKN